MSAQSPRPTDSEGLTRRALFRRGGAAAAGTAVALGGSSAIAPRFSPVGRARAAVPIAVVGVAAGAAALGYMGYQREGMSYFLGDSRDYAGYTGEDALHQEIVVGAMEMKSADERVMTGIENNITHADTVALTKGKAAVIEAMNAEKSESEAQTAMQDAIDSYFTTIQTNIIEHWRSQVAQIQHHYSQVKTHENLTADDLFLAHNSSAGWTHPSESNTMQAPLLSLLSKEDYTEGTYEERDITLLDGSTATAVPSATDPDGSTGSVDVTPRDGYSYHIDGGIDDTDGEPVGYLILDSFHSAWSSVLSQRDSTNSTLSGFVSDVYDQYEPGDIPTEDLVDPITASTELRQNYDNAAGQSAHAAMMGIPTTANLSANLEIQSDEADDGVWEIEADLFTRHVPREDVTDSASIDSSGVLTLTSEPVTDATYSVTTADDETVDVAAADFTESSGEWTVDLSGDLDTPDTSADEVLGEETGFETGETYQPSEWSDPFYIAYNYVDEQTGDQKGAFTQIESETKIVEVTDSNGDSVDNFKPESRNNQTADVAALEEELAQLREEQIRLQEEAQEKNDEDDGPLFGGLFDGGLEGGGGMLGLGIIGVVILAVIGIVTDAIPGLGN